MINISQTISLSETELEFSAIRAQGAGGQNVNKVSTAIHLRFDITRSGLPAHIKQRLLRLKDQRISNDGIIIIKAQRYRSQEKNKQEALDRLIALIRSVDTKAKKRIATRPSRRANAKRLDNKAKHGQKKDFRRKPEY